MSAPHPANLKVGKSILDKPEQALLRWLVPRMPLWITPDGCTFTSVPISAAIVGVGFWGKHRSDPALLTMSLLVVAHWFVDSIDGSLGRFRNTGSIRWGYYMDHLLDFFFLSSIFVAYGEMVESWVTPWIMIVVAAHMISGYLVMGAIQKFQIAHYGFGPTEGRLLVVLINIGLIVFGVSWLVWILPGMLAFAAITLIAVVYKEQKELRKLDKEAKDLAEYTKPARQAAASLFLQ